MKRVVVVLLAVVIAGCAKKSPRPSPPLPPGYVAPTHGHLLEGRAAPLAVVPVPTPVRLSWQVNYPTSVSVSSSTNMTQWTWLTNTMSTNLSWLGRARAEWFKVGGLTCHVTLAWNANTETNLVGYRLYCGTNGSTARWTLPVGGGRTNTTGTISNLVVGPTYRFWVSATNTAGLEGPASSPVVTFDSSVSCRPANLKIYHE